LRKNVSLKEVNVSTHTLMGI